MRRIGRLFPFWVILSLLIRPSRLRSHGFTAKGALAGLHWAGSCAFSSVHHVTWSVNSDLPHLRTPPLRHQRRSTNVWWLATFSLGESWHHNTDLSALAFMASRCGVSIDPHGMTIA